MTRPETGDETATGTAVGGLIYNGIAIRDRDGKLNLTDMWKASGADPSRQPAEWLRSKDSKRFADFLADTLNLGNSQDALIETDRGGREPGTWAHWQLGLAYAKYLSPAFHAWGNQVIRDRMEGKIGRPEELAPQFLVPKSMSEALRLAADQQDTIVAQNEAIAELDATIKVIKPQAEAMDVFRGSVGAVGVRIA
jgi:hypothetical protein